MFSEYDTGPYRAATETKENEETTLLDDVATFPTLSRATPTILCIRPRVSLHFPTTLLPSVEDRENACNILLARSTLFEDTSSFTFDLVLCASTTRLQLFRESVYP